MQKYAKQKYIFDIFVSHNSRQKAWVRQAVDQWRSLVPAGRHEGLTVFFDNVKKYL
jgi:hypothetical protein